MPNDQATIKQITLQDGRIISYTDQSSLLEALEGAKVDVHFQCREGFCGACRAKLKCGEVKYLNQPLAFVRKGEFLPCCSIPITNLEIDID